MASERVPITKLERIALAFAIGGGTLLVLVVLLPLVLGSEVDCFPAIQRAATVAAGLMLLLVVSALLVGLVGLFVRHRREPSFAPRRMSGVLLSVAVLLSLLFEPVNDNVRVALGGHTDFCICQPDGWLGHASPATWRRLRALDSSAPRETNY